MLFDIELTEEKNKEGLLAFELSPKPQAPIPIDSFELIRTKRPYEIMTDEELLAAPSGSVMITDVECFVNYTLVSFLHELTGKVVIFEQSEEFGLKVNRDKLFWIMNRFLTIGFNSLYFDVLIVKLIVQGSTCEMMKKVADFIILEDGRPYDIEERYGLSALSKDWNHIDIINVVPLKGSLKLYSGRLHCKRMQDMPVQHTKRVSKEDIGEVKSYNINDLDNTLLLYCELKPQLELRYAMSNQYGVDVRSKSDAQIAESVIISEIIKIKGYRPKRPTVDVGTKFRYNVPKFIHYETPLFQHMLDVVMKSEYEVNDGGSIDLPDTIKELKLTMGQCTYRMGIGGLHSSEESITHYASDDWLLIDRDVRGYYPRIIINTELYPHHLGKDFIKVYKTIFEKRDEAKKTGNTVYADSLKITVNGTFGKLGNQYSFMYAPDRIMHVCITGQISLLMLIEMMELNGIPVISANTDGILVKCPAAKEQTFLEIVEYWESITGFETEEGRYKSFHSRDVNNYIAIEENGKVKVKGEYAERGSSGNTVLAKNPDTMICNDAVIAFLTKEKAIEETIRECKDIRRFLIVRNVKGGAVKYTSFDLEEYRGEDYTIGYKKINTKGVELGRTVRWYFSTNMKGEINYITSGNKVPETDGGMPLMEIPENIPDDIDYDKYIAKANQILIDIGHTAPIAKQKRLFN